MGIAGTGGKPPYQGPDNDFIDGLSSLLAILRDLKTDTKDQMNTSQRLECSNLAFLRWVGYG